MRHAPKTAAPESTKYGALPYLEPAQGIEREVSRDDEIMATRSHALLQTSAESIQHLDEQGILTLQILLQHGDKYGYWQTPRSWSPVDHSETRMNIDLRKRIVHFLPKDHQRAVQKADEAKVKSQRAADAGEVLTIPTAATNVHRILDGAVLTFTRYLVLLRMGPSGIGSRAKNASLDPSNVKTIGYQYVPKMLAFCVSKLLTSTSPESLADSSTASTPPVEVRYLSLLQAEDIEQICPSKKKYAHIEVERMRVLSERGYWSDVPSIGEAFTKTTNVSGPPSPIREQRQTVAHLPLPDAYVSEMGRCSLWLIQDLAPSLLSVATEIQSIWQQTADHRLTPHGVRDRRRTQLKKFLSSYVWRDGQGSIVTAPPFTLRLTRQGKNSNVRRKVVKAMASGDLEERDCDVVGTARAGKVEWPPRTFGDIMGLMHNVQLAHLFVVSLSAGGRRSETLELKRTCIQHASNGMSYANGRTFKLVQRHDGEIRDWVLPDLAVQAIEQQVRLVRLAESIGPLKPMPSLEGSRPPLEPATHLWAQISSGTMSDRSAPLLNLGDALVSYANVLGMETAPGGQRLRPHRFRKTVARLVALALTQAPKVLMDVFGHKSIEMTLYYILADKDLQADIEKVSSELRVMRAKEAVEKMVSDEETQGEMLSLGGYGGPAALMVHRAIEVHKDRLHRRSEKWGAESAVELAELLTLQGKAWQFVRPGVICTKFPGTESGPCNKSKGHPEPASCQSHCKHRLEEAFLREDVDGAIREAVKAFNEAVKDSDDLAQALWAGQIRVHIGRFEDLKFKWMNDPTVQVLMEGPVMEAVFE